MAQQTINLGTVANDDTGDDLRAGGTKINENFTELYTAKQDKPAEGAFVDGDKTKLDGIEALADVTDTANVTAAGALMDSEVTNLAAVKAFNPADYATAAQGATADTALQSVAAADISDATADGIALMTSADANAFTDAEQSKLAGIETSATADQTGAEMVSALNTELGSTNWQTGGSSSGLTAVANIAALTAISEGGLTDGDVRWVEGFSAMNDGGQGVFVWDADNTATDVVGMIESPDTSDGTGRWIRQYSGPVNVKWFGAKGDGTTDDTDTIQAAIDIGNAYIPDGTYRLTSGMVTINKGAIVGEDPNNTILRINNGNSPINKQITIQSEGETSYTIADGTITAGTVTFSCSDTTGLAVDDFGILLLGTDPYDGNEEHFRIFTRVTAVVANTSFTVCSPVPESVNGTTGHTFSKFSSPAYGVSVESLGLDYETTNSTSGIALFQTQACAVRNIISKANEGAAVSVRESVGALVDGLLVLNPDNAHSAAGRAVECWGSQNAHIRSVTVLGHGDTSVFVCESQCRNITFEDITINQPNGSSGNNCFHIAGNSHVTIKQLHFSAAGGDQPLVGLVEGSTAHLEDIFLYSKPKSLSFQYISSGGRWFYNNKWYNGNQLAFSTKIRIKPSTATQTFNLPTGLITSATFRLNDLTGMASSERIYLFNSSNQGVNVLTSLSADTIYTYYPGIGVNYNINDIDAKKIVINSGACNYDTILEVTVRYMPLLGGSTSNIVLLREDHLDDVVTSTNLGDAAATINATGKYPGKKAYNSTNGSTYVADGSGTTSDWIDVDGVQSNITPA